MGRSTRILIYLFSILCTIYAKQHIPSWFGKGTFYPHSPGVSDAAQTETKISGAIRDVIRRNSQRYVKVLFRVNHPYVDFGTDDARMMTSRAKSKLDTLASMFYSSYRVKIRVIKAWTDNVDKDDMLSLHYEGRALEVQALDRRNNRLSQLAKKAAEAGFDFVWYKESDHIHVSVRPDVCQSKIELAVLVDHSGSIGWNGFRQTNAFLLKLIDYFNIGKDETRMAMAKFSTYVNTVHYLSDQQSKQALKSKVNAMRYEGGGTNTGGALELMNNTLFSKIHGMRDDATIPKIAILITDGLPMEQCYVCRDKTIDIAEYYRDRCESHGGRRRWCYYGEYTQFGLQHMRTAIHGIKSHKTIFVVGVGNVQESVMREMASEKFEDHYQKVDNYQDLSDFVDRIGSISCDEGALINNCTEAATDVYGGSFKYFQVEMGPNIRRVTIEVKDLIGKSFMFISCKVKNPGPLSDDKTTIKDTSSVSPRSIVWDGKQHACDSNIVYIAIQGQEDNNKFMLSMWDSLFEKDTDTTSILEDDIYGRPGRLIKNIKTKLNPDSYTYEIKDGNTNNAFSLDNFQLKTAKPLDRETIPSYKLSIVARDKRPKAKCHKGMFVLNVNVEDIDDNVPKFVKNQYTTYVREMTKSGVSIIQVSATDPDEGTNAELQYYIESGNDFKMDKNTGVVTTYATLDYEKKKAYTLNLTVYDRGNTTNYGKATLVVNIINVNEAPYFVFPECMTHGDTCKFETTEEQPIGTKVGQVIRATDPDKTDPLCQLTYETAPFEKYFTINKRSGEIHTKKKINREEMEYYRIEIKVFDCGDGQKELASGDHSAPLSVVGDVHVRAVDINDNRPQFENLPYSPSILEDRDVGTKLDIDIKAYDADAGSNGTIRYKILNGSDTFNIDPTTGDLTLGKELDRETTAKIKLIIRATDGGKPEPLYTDVDVNVTVLDVNDNDPIFQGNTSFDIVENVRAGGVVFTASASDKDEGSNGEVRYSMVKGDTDMFSVDIHGTVRNLMSPDREKISSYELTIKAYDLGTKRREATRVYTINVKDMNDNRPICNESVYTATVKENTKLSTKIIQVTAEDPDAGENGKMYFSLDHHDTFELLNRWVILKKRLDYATKSNYKLKVIVKDGGKESKTGFCALNIKVEDVNEYKPEFDRTSYTAYLDENKPIGTSVLAVHATDKDTGTSGKIEYSIIARSPEDAFTINPVSGKIYTSKLIDYEVKEHRKYTLTVEARDLGISPQRSTCDVTVNIRDVNDNTPTPTSIRRTVAENKRIGYRVGTITATDKDSGNNGKIVFASASPGMPFTVASNGVVTVSGSLDREKIGLYRLLVNASDKGTPVRWSLFSNLVTISDINDNSPIFRKNPYICNIMENKPFGTVVCTVEATDRDIGQNKRITYTMEQNEYLRMDENSGHVTVVNPIDREKVKRLSYKVTAYDHGIPRNSNITQLNVNVLDENDNNPYCSQSKYIFDITEENDDGATVGVITATDNDAGSNAEITFALEKGHVFDSKARFSLTQRKNVATLKASKLDYEQRQRYSITVKVTDHGRPSLSSTCTVEVRVIDINDNAPILSMKKYKSSVKEDVAINTFVLKVTATDADSGNNALLSYQLTAGDHQETFHLNRTSGVLKTAKQLDYEKIKGYEFNVTVSDQGVPRPKTASGTIIVSVINVEDVPPVFENVSKISVLEDKALNIPIMQFKAKSQEKMKLTYEIVGGNIGDKFKVGRDTGELALKKHLDRENQDFYNLSVSSRGDLKATNVTLPITVLDVNDNRPEFSEDPYKVTFMENHVGDLVQVYASDKDIGVNKEIEFSFLMKYSQFSIDKSTGEIKVKEKLDREKKDKYTLQVIANNSKSAYPLMQLANLMVTVLDENDVTPKFKQTSYVCDVYESYPAPLEILQGRGVHADDEDLGNKGTVRYRIKSENPAWKINTVTGEITTTMVLDREKKSQHNLTIEAYDLGQSHRSSSVQVIANVIDVNDNSPVIEYPATINSISESSQLNVSVCKIIASDKDIGPNKELEFKVYMEGEKQIFGIDKDTGNMYLRNKLDAEEALFHDVQVVVVDKGIPPLSTQKIYRINVSDANDNPPVFAPDQYEAKVNENTQGRTHLLTLSATDADVTKHNSDIKYSLEDNDGIFHVDSTTGNVYVSESLDYEKKKNYTFTAIASDGKYSDKAPVKILVNDINDHSPSFQDLPYNKIIPENSDDGTPVLTVKATDVEPGALTYAIIPTDANVPFQINPHDGTITVFGEVDREKNPFFQFKVIAKDGGVPKRLNATADVKITIRDVNDNAPIFQPYPKTCEIEENKPIGSFIANVTATDKDIGENKRIKYYIGSDGREDFIINEDTGQITTKQEFDREKLPALSLSLYAVDQGSPHLASENISITIIILDVNDNSPTCSKDYLVDLYENNEPGLLVAVEATDPDSGENGAISYDVDSRFKTYFYFKNNTGDLWVNRKLDRERRDRYTIPITAYDHGKPRRSTPCFIHLKVLDVNDNPPIIRGGLHGEVKENQPEGTSLLDIYTKVEQRIIAHDSDIGSNRQLEYHLSGYGNEMFSVSNEGYVKTRQTLDREETDNFTLTVTVQDKGKNPLKTNDTLHIKVLDEDDNCPVFEHLFYDAEVKETPDPRTTLVTVRATDRDIGSNADPDYGLLTGDTDIFKVDKITGDVGVLDGVELDRALKSVYDIRIRAGPGTCGHVNKSEGEKPVQKSYVHTNVHIKVIDMNNNAPEFHNGHTKIIFDDIDTKEIIRLKITDRDLGDGGKWRTTMMGQKRYINNQFTVNNVTIKASDLGNVSKSSTLTIMVENHVPCDDMVFDVSSDGIVTVQSICAVNVEGLPVEPLVGKDAVLRCNATGNIPVTYQWIRNGNVEWYNDRANGTYIITNITKGQEGEYVCWAQGVSSKLNSTSISIKVEEEPKITEQPTNSSIDKGKTKVFMISATGDPLPTFQWKKNDIIIRDGTDRTLTLSKVTDDDTAYYHCVVTNKRGTIESNTVRLTVVNRATVVTATVKVNIPTNDDKTHEKCHNFSVQDFQARAGKVLKKELSIISFKPLGSSLFCNVTDSCGAPCLNGGSCQWQKETGYQCACPPAWRGDDCGEDIDECIQGVCVNGATNCTNLNGSFICTCPMGLTGHRCEYQEDACVSAKCRENQICVASEQQRKYTCVNKDHNLIQLNVADDMKTWTKQGVYEFTDNLYNAMSSLPSASREFFPIDASYMSKNAVPYDLSSCRIHINNRSEWGQIKDRKTTKTKIIIPLECPKTSHPIAHASVEVPTTVIEILCKTLFKYNALITECGQVGGPINHTDVTSLDPATAEINIVLRDSAGWVIPASDAIQVMKDEKLIDAIAGVTVDNFHPTYKEGIHHDDTAGNGTAIIISVCVCVVVVVAIGAFLFTRERRRKRKLRDSSLMEERGKQAQNLDYPNNAYDESSDAEMIFDMPTDVKKH